MKATKYKKRGRKPKREQPGLTPRREQDLPDFEEEVRLYSGTIKKICRDIKRNFWRQIGVPELEKEIYSTVMVELCIIWDWYRLGITDEFPPNPGYLYKASWFSLLRQWAPAGDLCRYYWMNCYDTIENYIGNIFDGNFIIADKNVYRMATREDKLNNPETKEFSEGLFKGLPDLLDFWFIGFSLEELSVIYGRRRETVAKWLHHIYDHLEKTGATLYRPRPKRRRPGRKKKKHFKKKKLR